MGLKTGELELELEPFGGGTDGGAEKGLEVANAVIIGHAHNISRRDMVAFGTVSSASKLSYPCVKIYRRTRSSYISTCSKLGIAGV